MYDLDTTSTLFPSEPLMAPYWSREAMDYCYSTGGRTCEGVWFRTMPFDGQGKTVTADITDDTTWYAIDSPIKVNPADASGYLSITADLTIEPGVEVIVGEGKEFPLMVDCKLTEHALNSLQLAVEPTESPSMLIEQ